MVPVKAWVVTLPLELPVQRWRPVFRKGRAPPKSWSAKSIQSEPIALQSGGSSSPSRFNVVLAVIEFEPKLTVGRASSWYPR
jgi:hypothetical protein